jgi:hypothetical protein
MKNLECVNKINTMFIFILLLYIMLSNTVKSYVNSTFTFVFENYKQILLLILVFIIIFIVEYITNINAIIYGVPQIPGLSSAIPLSDHKKSHVIKKKEKRRIKK